MGRGEHTRKVSSSMIGRTTISRAQLIRDLYMLKKGIKCLDKWCDVRSGAVAGQGRAGLGEAGRGVAGVTLGAVTRQMVPPCACSPHYNINEFP